MLAEYRAGLTNLPGLDARRGRWGEFVRRVPAQGRVGTWRVVIGKDGTFPNASLQTTHATFTARGFPASAA